MEFSSLPQFPKQSGVAQVRADQGTPVVSPQIRRILIKFAWPALIVTVLFCLRYATAPKTRPPVVAPAQATAPTPLDFNLVELWWDRSVGALEQRRDEVEEEIGPPTERNYQNPEHIKVMKELLWIYRHSSIPLDREWVRWVDPRNPEKSVTVLFAGGKVYWKSKKGF